MEEILKQKIFKFIDFDSPLILCVSGGKDSVCMLDLVMSHKNRFSYLPEIVHFNHGLRYKSKSEEKFVAGLAAAYGINCNIYKIAVKEYAARNSLSIEEAARILRYEKLSAHTSIKGGTGCVFTAHSASDQLETVIFRIAKGTGRSGLLGIRKEIKLSSGWRIMRPLLDVSASRIMDYVRRNRLKFCTDKSNFNLNIPRNFIRHRITKNLRKINPSIEESIVRETVSG